MRILIVMKQGEDAQRLRQHLSMTLGYPIDIFCVNNSLECLIQYNQSQPAVVIIDADMPTLNGFSVVSILRDADTGRKCLMYVIGRANTPLIDPDINCFFQSPLDYERIAAQLLSDFDKKDTDKQHSELEKAKQDQKKLLPEPVTTNAFKVDYIYSPFDELSGDCLDYWFGQDKKGLYGFLFDCTGHNINAFSQVLEIRALFHISFRYYQRNEASRNLGKLMQNINEELFRLHNKNVACCAGVAFYIDFQTLELRYCSAGIPNFFIRRIGNTDYEEIEMQNYLIGYVSAATFDEKRLSLDDVSEVIFSSDGFSELLYKSIMDLEKAKHDDTSAVFIRLKKLKTGVQNGHPEEA